MKSDAIALSAKDRLLQASIKIFASCGYEGASTRALTKEAGVNISAIPYYFKDKEGLYRSVLEFIAGKVRAEMAAKTGAVRAVLKDETVSADACRAMLRDLLASFIRFLMSEEMSPSVARIFMREQIEPSVSFTMFYETTMRPMHETLTQLVARAAALPYPSEEATLCAHAVLGSITIFKTHRELALRRLKWKNLGNPEIEKITAVVLRHADAAMDSYSGKEGKKS